MRARLLVNAVWRRLAWALPREVVYHAVIRAFAHASTGPRWGDVHPLDLRFDDVLDRLALCNRCGADARHVVCRPGARS